MTESSKVRRLARVLPILSLLFFIGAGSGEKIDVPVAYDSDQKAQGKDAETIYPKTSRISHPLDHADDPVQPVLAHSGIDLRRRNLRVPQRPLHEVEVAGLVVESRREGVAESIPYEELAS